MCQFLFFGIVTKDVISYGKLARVGARVRDDRPPDRAGHTVLSVTTDGFLADADPAAVEVIQGCGFVDLFRRARVDVAGQDETIWECM